MYGHVIHKPINWRLVFGFSPLDHLVNTQSWIPCVIRDKDAFGDRYIGNDHEFWPDPEVVEYEVPDTEQFTYFYDSPINTPSRINPVKAFRIHKHWDSFDGSFGSDICNSNGSELSRSRVLAIRIETAHQIKDTDRLRVAYRFNFWSQYHYNTYSNPIGGFFYIYLFRYRYTGSNYVLEYKQIVSKTASDMRPLFGSTEFLIFDDLIENSPQAWNTIATHTNPKNEVGAYWITLDRLSVSGGLTGQDLDFTFELMDLRIWTDDPSPFGVPQVMNAGIVRAEKKEQIRAIGDIAILDYWNQIRSTGQVDFVPLASGIRNTGMVQYLYEHQIRVDGNVSIIPFDNDGVGIRHTGSISPIPFPPAPRLDGYDFNHDVVWDFPSHGIWEHRHNSPPSYVQGVVENYEGRLKCYMITDEIPDSDINYARWNFNKTGVDGDFEVDINATVTSGVCSLKILDLFNNLQFFVLFTAGGEIKAYDGLTPPHGLTTIGTYSSGEWFRVRVSVRSWGWNVYINDSMISEELPWFGTLVGQLAKAEFGFGIASLPPEFLGSGDMYIDNITLKWIDGWHGGRAGVTGDVYDSFREGIRNRGNLIGIPYINNSRVVGEILQNYRKDQIGNVGDIIGIPYAGVPITPVDGIYKATFNFKDNADYSTLPPPSGWTQSSSPSSDIYIRPEYAGHRKVIYLDKGDITDVCEASYISSTRTDSVIEFWINPDWSNSSTISIYNGGSELVRLQFYSNRGLNYDLRLWNGAGYVVVGSYSAYENQWIHIRLTFNWTTNKFSVDMNLISQVTNFSLLVGSSGWTRLRMWYSGGDDFPDSFQFDALGLSEDLDYSVGDNLTLEEIGPYPRGFRNTGSILGDIYRSQFRVEGFLQPRGNYLNQIQNTGWSGVRPRRPPFDLRSRMDFFRRRMRGRVKLYHYDLENGSYDSGYYQKSDVEEFDITDYCYFILTNQPALGYEPTGIDHGDFQAYLVIDSSLLPTGLPEINEFFDMIEYEGIKYRFVSHSKTIEEYYGLVEYKLTSMWHVRDHFLIHQSQARVTGRISGELYRGQALVRGRVGSGYNSRMMVTGDINLVPFTYRISVKGSIAGVPIIHNIRAVGEIYSNPYYHGIRVEGDLEYAHKTEGIRVTGYSVVHLYDKGIRSVGELEGIPLTSGIRVVGFFDMLETTYDILDEVMMKEPSDQLIPNQIKALHPSVKKWNGMFGSSGNPIDLDAKTIHEYKFRNKQKYFNKRIR